MSDIRFDLPRSLTLDTLPLVFRRWPGEANSIVVALAPGQWAHPEGIVALACLVEQAHRKGIRVCIDYTECPDRVSYWERMRFFDLLGLDGPLSSGVRGSRQGSFSELHRIEEQQQVDAIAEAVVSVFDLGSEARKICNHIVSEALNNVCQHSQAVGFCLAQYYPQKDEVHFCIGDYGVGLRRSLKGYRPSSDLAAVELALHVGVTRQAPRLGQREMRNRGVGLSAIERLVCGNRGTLGLWSGSGLLIRAGDTSQGRTDVPHWQGTLLVARLPRNQFTRNFHEIMRELIDDLASVENEQPRRWTRMP